MSKISFVVSAESIVLAYDGKNFRISRFKVIDEDNKIETENSKRILEAIRNKQLDSATSPIPKIVDIEESLKGSNFAIIDGLVYVDGSLVNKYINKKILEYKDCELPFESLVAFYRNVLKNPSQTSRDELFLFLENNGHALTEEGYFLAYKKVRTDFYSIRGYAGPDSPKSVLNAPGTWVECPRETVDPKRENTCSTGLHVANYDYANNSYGSHSDLLLEVIVDPKDVVTVPPDYNQKKMRTCRYYVVGPSANQYAKAIYDRHIVKGANTTNVSEGDFNEDEIVNKLVDEEIVKSMTPTDAEPVVDVKVEVAPTPNNEYYREYRGDITGTWRFNGYDPKTQTLEYIQAPFTKYSQRSLIKKGDHAPISWKATGSLIQGMWPVEKKTPQKSFNSIVSDFIGDKPVIDPKATKGHVTKATGDKAFSDLVTKFIDEGSKVKQVPTPKKPVPTPKKPAPHNVFVPKVDTKLNYLTQPRVGGKFAKRKS